MQFILATKGTTLRYQLKVYMTCDGGSVLHMQYIQTWEVTREVLCHSAERVLISAELQKMISWTQKVQLYQESSQLTWEIVATDDVLPQRLWTLYFLKAQGYKIDDNMLHQDNKKESYILSEINRQGESGNWDHNCWLFYQTTARIIVPTDARHDRGKHGDRVANRQQGRQCFNQEWDSSGVNPTRIQEFIEKQELHWSTLTLPLRCGALPGIPHSDRLYSCMFSSSIVLLVSP